MENTLSDWIFRKKRKRRRKHSEAFWTAEELVAVMGIPRDRIYVATIKGHRKHTRK